LKDIIYLLDFVENYLTTP